MKNDIYIMIGLIVFCFFVGCSFSEFPPPELAPLKDKPRPPLNVSDSLAIVAIYNKCGPFDVEWDLEDIMTWGGVQATYQEDIQEYRVTSFSTNRFRGGLPEEFRKLTELMYLGISGQHAIIIPPWIGELTKLERLTLCGSYAPGILPEEIGNLVKLRRLDLLSMNLIGEIPKSLANLKEAIIMDFTNNNLSGTFPLELLKDKRNYIDCTQNNITELPFEAWSDEYKLIPDLRKNRLSGVIPDGVFLTSKWKRLDFLVYGQQQGYGYSNYPN